MMIHTIKETVLHYPQTLLESWNQGRMDWVSSDLFVPSEVYEEPSLYFSKYYTLAQYNDKGWLGTVFYALGNWEVENPTYHSGRVLLAQYIDPIKLSLFKGLRTGITSGEPDLFLYKADGTLLFVVVKQADERLTDAQLICLSNIKSVLECDVEIVSLVEENHQYAAKSYEIKVVQFPKPLGV
ncbi:VRR-NUC domain-containing protein [Aliivibrio sp. S4TY2]|uniref:VRR-NUC domain-containing protein n=1 Tax=unclassified Aliivibrio TaxID=2645654 RepID=UPI00237806E0|nr:MULTISPECIES: VRR-NUC domain-containing protein [unclassified Aliivibrio]MDD9157606.1 VRR-NUC domain-containing protein [Aliivibrio sp. S4TY2]MDD9161431.1 VRR-NUC domain-containing protein [Aliivibrio sp. S4TY1]MDD9165516.1 VRR-NUC domain-containing protein [Aliivibrio sp. S4MY2]MDD9169460.1 VRR-NUC domain-containing protein [Aliivibrio sp. S4MY4]MDD9186453.1 VRR-NUC domain-containing protein [Aliivibrio sp. S4MY3]